MDTDTYRVIFRGEIQQGCNPDDVKANLTRLFKLDTSNDQDKSKLEKLFSGRPVIIKAGINQDVAEAYQDAIAKSGGKADIDPRPLDRLPPGISERRISERRVQPCRRAQVRSSAILPDRRKNAGRRKSDRTTED